MDRKILFVGIGSLILIAIVAAATFVFGKPAAFRGTTYAEPYPPAPEFSLTRADGANFSLNELRGKITLVFFGYTSCPDVCPTTLAELNQALARLKPSDADRVKVVFITVDPERDTPEKTQAYVNNFNSGFIGLSGTEEELSPVWNNYGVYREIDQGTSAVGYLVNHTARVTLIDMVGNLRVSFGFDTPVEDIAHDLELVLKEK